MASGIFAVFDDIAMLLDDAAMMSKVATKKTATLLSDDLAVNAQKASGFVSSRELPVLWAITRGSFLNKLIIVPIALLLSAFADFLIVPILLLGGIYLSYEGMEKILEYFIAHSKKMHLQLNESQKIKSAILTDFILSIEIIIIALDTVRGQELGVQILVVSLIAILATIGVYGFVALLVRLDDLGFKLIEVANTNKLLLSLGKGMVSALPWIIKILSVIGTLAMLLVAGGIYLHNIGPLHDFLHRLPVLLAELLIGAALGALVLPVSKGLLYLLSRLGLRSPSH